ncbi:hypothetical protein [Larkinella soli]|uniref:hypothetical protein n=1 Tax=Larkinella soli TaxID=1770527 RepID=UPI000FFBDB6C|nr:hypothetical protein [Larkinella soli]
MSDSTKFSPIPPRSAPAVNLGMDAADGIRELVYDAAGAYARTPGDEIRVSVGNASVATYADALTYVTTYETATPSGQRRYHFVEVTADETAGGVPSLYRYVPTDSSPKLRWIVEA